MTALIAADLHYNLRQYDWLLEVAGRYEAVILAGDLLDLAAHADLDTQIVVVTKYLARIAHKSRLVVCSGDHDADGRDFLDEPIFDWFRDVRADGAHADGEHLPLGPALISVCPWCDSPVAKARLERFLATSIRPAAGPWIWIHHVPPSGSLVAWTGREHVGDDVLPLLIDHHRPELVVCGHVHDAPFRDGGAWVDRLGDTIIVNPGHQLGAVPAVIELDLEGGRLVWTSREGSGSTDPLPNWSR